MSDRGGGTSRPPGRMAAQLVLIVVGMLLALQADAWVSPLSDRAEGEGGLSPRPQRGWMRWTK